MSDSDTDYSDTFEICSSGRSTSLNIEREEKIVEQKSPPKLWNKARIIRRGGIECRTTSAPILSAAKSKPAITVRLKAEQKTRWDKLNELTSSMKSANQFNSTVLIRKAHFASCLMSDHIKSIPSKTTTGTIGVTLIEKKVTDLFGFLKKKMNSGMDAESAAFVVDHFCEEICFLFLVATQEDAGREKPGAGCSYVIWRPQNAGNSESEQIKADEKRPSNENREIEIDSRRAEPKNLKIISKKVPTTYEALMNRSSNESSPRQHKLPPRHSSVMNNFQREQRESKMLQKASMIRARSLGSSAICRDSPSTNSPIASPHQEYSPTSRASMIPVGRTMRQFRSCPSSEEIESTAYPTISRDASLSHLEKMSNWDGSSEKRDIGMRNNTDHEEMESELCSSLRSIRGSAKKKRLQRMKTATPLNSDTSLVSEPTCSLSPQVTSLLDTTFGTESISQDSSKLSLVSKSKEKVGQKIKQLSDNLSELNLATLFTALSTSSLKTSTNSEINKPDAEDTGQPTESCPSTQEIALNTKKSKSKSDKVVNLTIQKPSRKRQSPRHNYSNPSFTLENALTLLSDKKAQWENIIEAINDVKDLSANHPEILLPKANEATALVISQCNSLRSKIAGAAIDALKLMFARLRKKLVPNLNAAIGALITESGKENIFIREKCERCLHQVVDSMIQTKLKLVLSLGQYIRNKHHVKRCLAARFLNHVEETLGVDKCLSGKDLTEKLLTYMAISAFDANQDVRYWGRRSVIFLSGHKSFRQLCQRQLSKDDTARIFQVLKSSNSRINVQSDKPEIRSSISVIGKKMYSTM